MLRIKGFTLVELMVALVIASILITIAVPSYRRYIIRTHRTDAITALTRIQAAQEKHFLQYNSYASDLEPAPPEGLALPEVSDSGFYDITPDFDALEYRAKATPRAGTSQTKDERCQVFEVDHTGIKRATDRNGADRTSECWR